MKLYDYVSMSCVIIVKELRMLTTVNIVKDFTQLLMLILTDSIKVVKTSFLNTFT